MPRDASGNFTLPTNDSSPAAPRNVIRSSDFNELMTDITSGLTDSLSRSGDGAMQAALDMGAFDITNAGDVGAASIFGVTPGDAGKAILADALQADVRDYLDIPPYVADRTALKALDTTKDTVAYLKEAGRQGIFQWTTGDFSALITADTQEGVYVKADAIASTSGAWVRVGDQTVYHFGGSATANSATAISAMATVMGFVRFPAGATKLGANLTVTVPIYFDTGAYVTVDATFTLTISNSITSPRQWVFRGDGSYSLTQDNTSDTGENAREVHASWFGAFPNPDLGPDQAPFINKAFSSMGNGRESIVHFDIGNYNVASQILITRGGHVKGAGTRRTVFKISVDGFSVFKTDNVAVKFSGIQFELHSALSTRANAFIEVAHDDCEVYNVNVGQTELGVVVSGGVNCRIWNIGAAYGANKAAGSSVVKITGGGLHSVKGVRITSSGSLGPTHIVDVSAAASLSNVEIEDIQTISPAIPVLVRAAAASVTQISVRNVTYSGFAGSIPAALVHVLAESTFSIANVSINGVVSNSRPSSAIRIESTSSGTTENIVIDNVVLPGSTGSGIEFVRSAAGVVRDIVIGGAVDVSERATPYAYTGTITGVRISPTAMKNALPVVSYDFDIADDSVASINLQRSVFAGWLMIAVGNVERAIYTFRAASAPSVTAFGTPSANMNTATTALTGTTGVDTKFTTGVTDGILYFENRLGTAARVNVTLMAPNA